MLKPHTHDDVVEDLITNGELTLADFLKASALIEGDGAMVLVIGAQQHPLGANLAGVFQGVGHQLAAGAGAVIF